MINKKYLLLSLYSFVIILLTGCTEPDTDVSYGFDIQPIFNSRCIHCHGNRNPAANLTLTNYDSLMVGDSYSGPVVNPNVNPDYNILIKRITGETSLGPRMPYDGPPYLDDHQIDLIWRWIYQGAKDN